MVIGIDASRVAREDKTGTENYSWNLIKSIAQLDKTNRYVLYFNKLPPFFEITQGNVSSRQLKAIRFWTQFRLAWECLLNPPDVLFVPAHTIPVIHRPALKTVVTIHDLGAEFLPGYHKFPQKIYLNWSTAYATRAATHLIAVSEFTKKDLVKRFKVPAKRISVVYEGVDRKIYFQRKKEEIVQVLYKYGLNRKYLFYVGTIQPRKNLKNLIEAFAKANLKNIDLVLAGGSGWLEEDIYSAPKKFGVENRVRFLGYVPGEDLPALYSGALALTFPSLYEGFGLPIIEAFSTNCPVITSNRGAMAEIANDSALLVDPENIDSISSGIKKIVDNDSLRQLLVEKGQRRVEDFTWEKAALKTVKVFEKVIKV